VVQNTVKQRPKVETQVMRFSVVGALASLLLWIFLAFVAAIPSGWVHVPLIAAVVLIAIAIPSERKT
jgi:uncharacterized membrane protein (DUF485 family)